MKLHLELFALRKKETVLKIKGIQELDFILLFIWVLNQHVLLKSTCTMVVGTFLFRLCTGEVRCLTLDSILFSSDISYVEKAAFRCSKSSSDGAACFV